MLGCNGVTAHHRYFINFAGVPKIIAMITNNPLKIVSSKLWMQTRITYWKFKLVTADLLKN